MRIWDISPSWLCRQHLLAEHRELHAIWTILTQKKKGYRQHPEVRRWIGRLKALYLRHEREIHELKRRGYRHCSQLDKTLASGKSRQTILLNTRHEQQEILRQKNCSCLLSFAEGRKKKTKTT
ncbi:MAG TPA: pyrimidine dimer DNA glycosylase/endonuclease V [Patescibacteria group bacterium]|nr:pyrimidine dimer DNA glycosylase/endonuclease V [Patescibacteria group bacterium]